MTTTILQTFEYTSISMAVGRQATPERNAVTEHPGNSHDHIEQPELLEFRITSRRVPDMHDLHTDMNENDPQLEQHFILNGVCGMVDPRPPSYSQQCPPSEVKSLNTQVHQYKACALWGFYILQSSLRGANNVVVNTPVICDHSGFERFSSISSKIFIAQATVTLVQKQTLYNERVINHTVVKNKTHCSSLLWPAQKCVYILPRRSVKVESWMKTSDAYTTVYIP
jgi:hypothetical protein